MPDTEFPPASYFDVRATYDLTPAHREIIVPHTDPRGDVTVFQLVSEPAAASERYDTWDGKRYLRFHPGVDRVRVHAHGRIYGVQRGDAPWFRPLRELFVGARIQRSTSPSP